MDRVRLGRVLGRGARMAARTAYDALAAATAVPPNTAGRPPIHPVPSSSTAVALPPHAARSGRDQAGKTTTRILRATARSGGNILTPVRRASRAVLLEVTGSFFTLFAFSFALGLWRKRADLLLSRHASAPEVGRIFLYVAITLFFGYCAITSFVRARRLR